jgi:hypothetical protein
MTSLKDLVRQFQRDQIGQIIAYWAIAYIGQFIQNYGTLQHFFLLFSW